MVPTLFSDRFYTNSSVAGHSITKLFVDIADGGYLTFWMSDTSPEEQ